MTDFRRTLGFGNFEVDWEKFRGTLRYGDGIRGAIGRQLTEAFGFGSNPGKLRMFTYRPKSLSRHPALVVVLHGCTQTATGYDVGAGWSTLADRYGFALLLPEQQRSNNPNGCFSWYLPEHSRRNQGEPRSIREMVEKAVLDYGVDRRRIFITGLSAGGAMCSNMLACYPEVFAAGAIIAGLPYGAATNVQEAFETMHQGASRPAREWGNLVRQATGYAGPWPRISVWHGDADVTVVPSNALSVIRQWADVHGLPLTPSLTTRVDGYPREVWLSKDGEELIESYAISNMAHGTPLATRGDTGEACGTPGPFLLPVGSSSSYHIAKFFGITSGAAATDRREKVSRAPGPPASNGSVLETDTLMENERSRPHSNPHLVGVGTLINNALKAAGLIKSKDE